MKSKTAHLALVTLLALTTIASADFFNGFEIDTDGWSGVSRTASGGSVPQSSPLSFYHGETAAAYTYWGVGGNDPIWPGGFTTSIDLYLDTSLATGTQFDWSQTISLSSGGDSGYYYVFNGGVYDNGFRVGASETLGNPDDGTDYFLVSESGWYTLEHTFSSVGTNLSVALSILDNSGIIQDTWVLGGVSMTNLGGSGVGYLLSSPQTTFAIDNTSLTVVPVPAAVLLGSFGLGFAGYRLRRRET